MSFINKLNKSTKTMKIKKANKPPEESTQEIKTDFDNTQFAVPTASSSINKKYLISGAGVFVILTILALYFFVLKNDLDANIESTKNSTGNDDLKRKELELKERELKLREKQLNQSRQTGSTENNEPDNEKEDIRNTVNNLLTAWQNKDVKGFFVNLTQDYRYESIEGVKRNYDERYNKAYEIFANNNYINITVWDMSIDVNGNYAEVRYRQKYSSSTLNDTTTKKLFLRKDNNGWKVYKELSGFN